MLKIDLVYHTKAKCGYKMATSLRKGAVWKIFLFRNNVVLGCCQCCITVLRIQFHAATCSAGSLSRECVINIVMGWCSSYLIGFGTSSGNWQWQGFKNSLWDIKFMRRKTIITEPERLQLDPLPSCHPLRWVGPRFPHKSLVSRFEPSQPFGFIYVSHSPASHLFLQETRRCLRRMIFFGCCCCLSILSHQIYGGRWYIGLVGIPSDPFNHTNQPFM